MSRPPWRSATREQREATHYRKMRIELLEKRRLLVGGPLVESCTGVSGGSGFFLDSGQNLGQVMWSGTTVALGDVDADGDLDAFLGQNMWRNDGQGHFTLGGEMAVRDGDEAAVLGDLDRDGDLDAVLTNSEGYVFLNNGSGHFTWVPYLLGHWSNHAATALGDLDGDGDLDAFAAISAYPNQVWLNGGSGVLVDSGQRLGNSHSWGVELGDLDGDGDLDAFVANGPHFQDDPPGKPNMVWLNDGHGNFIDSGQRVGDSDSRDVVLTDIDVDGDLDAVVANVDGPDKVWLNDGQGLFYHDGGILSESASTALALGDVDGDGDLDAFVTDGVADDGNLDTVWLNTGGGRFIDTGQSLGDSGFRDVALGDVDGDGDLDAVLAGYRPDQVWLNDGQGLFTDTGQRLGDSRSADAAMADLDGDGDLDAFVVDSDSNYGLPNRVYLNDGQGRFQDSGQRLGSSESRAVALGDLDGDGDLDAFVANYGNQPNKVWLNDGSAQFSEHAESLGDSSSRDVALGDLDGDGDLDAFVANPFANKVWFNDGDAGFIDSGQNVGDLSTARVALGDLDGDGDLDAFAANARSPSGDGAPNEVWLNDGHGHFIDSGQELGHAESSSVALGDLDGDGDLDAYVANDGHPDTHRVWLNDGQARFIDSGQELAGHDNADVALGDLNGDGHLDVFLTENRDQHVWLNDGQGRFRETVQYFRPRGRAAKAVVLGDVDGDDDLDAFVVHSHYPDKVWLNQTIRIVGRHLFYNCSDFDGANPLPTAADDDAIAVDKQPLLPGQTAAFANYSSYDRGINGVMVDITNLPGTPEDHHFRFRVGNSDDPDTWARAPDPTRVTVRRGAGVGGSDRISMVWDNNTIQNQWLQVTVLASVETGLIEHDVFYFGNAIGECGNSAADALVNAADMLAARDNPHSFLNPAPVDCDYDYDRNTRVNAIDMLIARDNRTHFVNALKLITPVAPGAKITPATTAAEAETTTEALQTAEHQASKAEKQYEPNQPVGVAQGLNPGRVTWVPNPDATSWNGSSGHWWDDTNTDPALVGQMVSGSVCWLAGDGAKQPQARLASRDAVFELLAKREQRRDKAKAVQLTWLIQ